ncbi:MAG: tetratricopeptide repeat protein, partial [Desulforhopalus sp.]|nr:tetratricopeptide repeat protein [Desulforhopalus sp.]
MSLLMEALRRAQQVQEATAEDSRKTPPPPPETSPLKEEILPNPDIQKSLPAEGALELELIEEEPLIREVLQEKVQTREEHPPPDHPIATEPGEISPKEPLAPAPPEGRPAAGSPRNDAFGGSLEASRQAAQAMFLAKKRQKRQSGLKRMLLIALLALFGIAAAGGFLLLSSRDIWQHSPPIAQPRPDAPQVTLPEAETSQVTTALATGTAASEGSAEQPSSPAAETAAFSAPVAAATQQTGEAGIVVTPAPAPAADPAAVLPAGDQAEPLLPGLPAAPSTTGEMADATRYEPEPLALPQPPPPIRITRQTLAPQSDLRLGLANTAFQQGRPEQARTLYQQILSETPNHRGAHLGLAALAVQDGNIALAQKHYLDLLEQDPADPLARVGLISIIPQTDLLQLESELKRLLTIHPDLAPLSFLLGNLYAAGQRWPEAQQAYFQALEAITRYQAREGGAIAPDYPFNLAVSLEHLDQPRVAARYYRQALQLADSYPAG